VISKTNHAFHHALQWQRPNRTPKLALQPTPRQPLGSPVSWAASQTPGPRAWNRAIYWKPSPGWWCYFPSTHGSSACTVECFLPSFQNWHPHATPPTRGSHLPGNKLDPISCHAPGLSDHRGSQIAASCENIAPSRAGPMTICRVPPKPAQPASPPTLTNQQAYHSQSLGRLLLSEDIWDHQTWIPGPVPRL